MLRRIIPDVVRDQNITIFAPSSHVLDAVKFMTAKHIGAIVVGAEGRCAGIFSERDLLTRVVAKGLDPSRTRLDEVMTRKPFTVGPEQAPVEALDLMHKHGFRHLPVVDQAGLVLGVVSVRDLYAVVRRELESELRQMDAYVHDTGYGAAR